MSPLQKRIGSYCIELIWTQINTFVQAIQAWLERGSGIENHTESDTAYLIVADDAGALGFRLWLHVET